MRSHCTCETKSRAAVGPHSSQMVWIKPPPPLPIDFLHMMPVMSSPRSTRTPTSSTEKSMSSASRAHADVRMTLTSGVNMENTCLPVHRGSGLMMAGFGTLPSQLVCHMRMFMKTSFVMNVSRLVIRRHARSVSCTIAITGLFACGDTIIFGTIISSCTSARVSMLCGRCMFISSPSKSALYGGVTEMFIRKVE